MAKANTYELEHSGYFWKEQGCIVCGSKEGKEPNKKYGSDGPYRLFYYPTFMNGDAEWIADFCYKHKKVGRRLKQNLETDS